MRKKYKKTLHHVLTVIAIVLIGGFTWVALTGFNDLSFFSKLTPSVKIILGIVGIIIVGIVFKKVFHVNIRNM